MSADIKLTILIACAFIAFAFAVHYLTRPGGWPPKHGAVSRKKVPEHIFRAGGWFIALAMAFITGRVFITYWPDMPLSYTVIIVACVVVIVFGFVWQPNWPWNQQPKE
jgi:uncharacterized protein YacL